ncbi:ABC-type antimicrobial peptide transport system, ATPase component [Magnetospirillum sp. XM-1]|uniref:ABC transporter ATP-binding protein n=1 Tax=Magnetospirillum sp. XM-1 TaxID=1663591 RepID=UPI00073DFB42|nr:ABC transporter ATP-binding protein [Magnetospirillum sp. XM-1]CUW41052.1 ABC-type antimicrobial peptide transport system, ATPase component [Magnetospirillum sp. XM-1]
MIHLSDVRKAFNQGKANEFWALKGIDLTVPAGKVTVFRGPSGSGKTTLLTLVGCLARPTSGRVRLKDRDISGLPERFLTDIRRSTFGFVFQQFNLLKGISAHENVMIPAYPLGTDRHQLSARAHALMESLDIAAKAHSMAEWLSGGEAQRVAIARALINDPEVVIADEPTANLDSERSKQFLGIVETLKGAGKTVLMTSHDPLVCDTAVVDHVVSLRDGQLVEAR